MRAAGEADAGRGEIFHPVLFDRRLKSREAGCGDTLSEGLGIRGLDDDDELIYGPYFLYEICIARAFMSSQENICNALVRWCASRNVKLTDALRWQQLLNYLERLDQQKDDDAISIDTPDSNMSEDEDL